MAAHQAPLSLGFSRQDTGVGCHFLLQCMKVKSGSEVAQSLLTLSDPMDCNLPGSSIHGILQARILEWGAIAFSRLTFISKVRSLIFNTLPRCVIVFLPRSKCLLILWLLSPSALILEPKKIKSVTVSIVSPSICPEVMGLNAMIFIFLS